MVPYPPRKGKAYSLRPVFRYPRAVAPPYGQNSRGRSQIAKERRARTNPMSFSIPAGGNALLHSL